MEKDFFLDRSYASSYNNLLRMGDMVYICEKSAQKYAQTINHLTKGIIVRKLTSALYHPRGIKVEIQKENGQLAIGRVTYLCDELGNPLRTIRN